jgi:hypothetical protein
MMITVAVETLTPVKLRCVRAELNYWLGICRTTKEVHMKIS